MTFAAFRGFRGSETGPHRPKQGREDIIAFCRERLAAYKAPRIVEFRADLPKSMIGKVLRPTLREEVGKT